jgi:amino acid adenylation domain-containing protein
MENCNIQDGYPLSPLQQGMLFTRLYQPDSGVDIQQMLFNIREQLDRSAFNQAWTQVLDRHDVLRTSFKWDDTDEPMQVVQNEVTVCPAIYDWRQLSKKEQKVKLEKFLEEDRKHNFQMAEAPLLRIAVFYLDDAEYSFLLTYHHILLDGRSNRFVIEEFFSIYDALTEKREIILEKRSAYGDFIRWLGTRDSTRDESYWTQTLGDFSLPTAIPIAAKSKDKEAIGSDTFQEMKLSSELTERIKNFAKNNELTPNTLFQGAWALLLHHYTGDDDVVFGTIRACRHTPINGSESMVGLLINNLPMRSQVTSEQSLLSMLKELRRQQITLREYEHTSLVDIQSWSSIPPGVPLFESLITFNTAKKLNDHFRAYGGRWLHREIEFIDRPNVPINLMGFLDNELLIRIEYNRELFAAVDIKRILMHMTNLLESMVEKSDLPALRIPYLSKREEQQAVVDWNDTDKNYPRKTVLHEIFEKQVDRAPDAVALVFKDAELTYRELDNRANQVGRRLRSLGIGPESLVGVFMERSIEMVVALYGILKAGGAYVPLDPEYPKDRLAFMIEDTQIPVILTQKHLLEALPKNHSKIICLDADWNSISESKPDRLEIENTEENLAYVIFTSGSTGKPKGVMNEHRGICNRLYWMQDAYQLNDEDHVLQKTPFSFDVSVWEFFWPLLFGARLIIAPPGAHRDTTELVRLVVDHQVTTLHFVPSMMQIFLEDTEVEKCQSLKRVICSGEALPYDLQRRFFERIDAELHNLYGPTEAAVDVTYWECQRESDLNIVPIGWPIANTQMYILDRQMQPVPIGIAGELHIGGIQVARGYINRPELTAEKFIADPFSKEPGARLYKTGDLARYLNDGSIEYLGRIDFQVKIRGLRVELGEIETRIDEFDGISQCVVVLSEESPGDQQLVAYYVNQTGQEVDLTKLRDCLQSCLPDYMVPQHYMKLDAIPLSPNGKTDRKALPRPKFERKTDVVYLAPRIQEEKIVVDIWKELLRIDKVGIDDSFFDLGGHSLLLIRMLGKLKSHFEKELSVVDFFRYPTINKLVEYLIKEDKEVPKFTRAENIASKQKEYIRRQKKIASQKRKYHA